MAGEKGNGRATLEDSLTKLNILIANNPAITLLGIYAKELKTHTHKNLHTDGL